MVLNDICYYVKDKRNFEGINSTNYVTTDNMLPNKAGITYSEYLPDSGTVDAFKKGDVLISNIRPYFKKIWLADQDGGCCADVLILRPKGISSELLYAYLSQDSFFEYDTKGAKGSKMPRGDKNHIMQFPIVELKNGESIGKFIKNIDDKIALNNKTNTELENMAKTIYDYWFTQFDFPNKNGHPYKTSSGQMVYNEILKREIPAGWEVEQLRHYLDCNKNSITKNQKFDYINYLDTGSLTENIITEFQVIKNTDSLPSRAKRIVKKNDILYSSVRPLLKHYGIIKAPKENMIASTGFIILSSKVDSRYNDFFYNYIILESNLNKLVSIAASNVSAYPSITPDDLLDLYIPMPKDFNLLDDFISKIQPIYELINKNQKESEELTKFRDYLLPLLMNGQIEVK